MKVGTDGVLLGAWASLPTPKGGLCLDVGTGTGLIALMLAQRFPHAYIEGIDIDEASLEQARENVEASSFASQICIIKKNFTDINNYLKHYNLIVSNPPFYKEDTLSGSQARDAARHTTFLPFETLIRNAVSLLADEGHFAVIIPYSNASDFISLCAMNQLYLSRRTDVRSSERKPLKRTLLEFCRHTQPTITDTLTLCDPSGNRTLQYQQLTDDFYL